jgi:Rrf2 family protein
MLTQTSITALRVLVFLGMREGGDPISPRAIAEVLEESPTYLAKIAQHLTRADILRSHRGAAGGVSLSKRAENITLLAVVEACQGVVTADYCEDFDRIGLTCGFHQAMAELHAVIVGVLGKWTVAQLLQKPGPHECLAGKVDCKMIGRDPSSFLEELLALSVGAGKKE